VDDEVSKCNGMYSRQVDLMHNGKSCYKKKNRVVRFTAARRWAILSVPENIILVFSKCKNAKDPADVKTWMVLNAKYELIDSPNRFKRIRDLAMRIVSRGALKCVQTLKQILKFLIRDREKYGFIRSSNSRFSKEVRGEAGAIELLRTIGFRHTKSPEDGYRYQGDDSIECLNKILDIILDVIEHIDAKKILTVYCDICGKARIVKLLEVDARVFQEKDFPWQCKDLSRLGSCEPPDDELVKLAHGSKGFAELLERLGIRNRALLAAQKPELMFKFISKVCEKFTLALCEATVMKARYHEIKDFMEHQILRDCNDKIKNLLVQCEILTPKRLLSWKASALAGMLRARSIWNDGEAPTGLDVEKWQSIAKSCVESATWLDEHQCPPDVQYQ